jgi:hypothetical protein
MFKLFFHWSKIFVHLFCFWLLTLFLNIFSSNQKHFVQRLSKQAGEELTGLLPDRDAKEEEELFNGPNTGINFDQLIFFVLLIVFVVNCYLCLFLIAISFHFWLFFLFMYFFFVWSSYFWFVIWMLFVGKFPFFFFSLGWFIYLLILFDLLICLVFFFFFFLIICFYF